MGQRLNGVNTGGIPMYLINEFLKETDIPLFVELGTASGGSIKEAAPYFKECVTIEINEDRPLYDSTLRNVKWLIGNTIDILPGLIEEFINYKSDNKIEDHRYCLFWVDSHFDGDKPKNSKYKDCYLLEELDIISLYSQDSIIIIDDARLFMGNPPQPNNALEWPNLQQIFEKFRQKFPYFFVTIVDDYILAFPDRLKWVFDREWMGRYSVRYPSDADKLKSQVKDVYDALINYMK